MGANGYRECKRRNPPSARTTERSCWLPQPMLAQCLVQISSQSRSSCAVLYHCLLTPAAVPSVLASTCLNTSNNRLSSKFANPVGSWDSSNSDLVFFMVLKEESWWEIGRLFMIWNLVWLWLKLRDIGFVFSDGGRNKKENGKWGWGEVGKVMQIV